MSDKLKRLRAALLAARDEVVRQLVESMGVARLDAEKAVCRWEHDHVCAVPAPELPLCACCQGDKSNNGSTPHDRLGPLGLDAGGRRR